MPEQVITQVRFYPGLGNVHVMNFDREPSTSELITYIEEVYAKPPPGSQHAPILNYHEIAARLRGMVLSREYRMSRIEVVSLDATLKEIADAKK